MAMMFRCKLMSMELQPPPLYNSAIHKKKKIIWPITKFLMGQTFDKLVYLPINMILKKQSTLR